MPTVSERQRRAMWAAAQGKSMLGIPREVGKEFVAADSSPVAAGVLYTDKHGNHLLAKRGGGARDYPGCWAVPGGMIEPGELPEAAAIREFAEETGQTVTADQLVHLGDIDRFAVYHVVADRFAPAGDGENSEFAWVNNDSPILDPMHPGVAAILAHPEAQLVGANELGIARLMADGLVASPQVYANQYLFAVRITGTGVCYRRAGEQFAWRNPDDYLNADFVARCNGLPVIWEHPEGGTLDTDEFRERVIGGILLPYVTGSEVWGIAKVYDAEAASALVTDAHSTSPSVVTIGDALLTLADGSDIVLEGKPKLVDHLAICRQGVWDKGGEPTGVTTNHEEPAMADEALTKIMDGLEGLTKRIDAMEAEKSEAKAKADAEAKEAEDKAKADAEADEKAKADAAAAAKVDSEVASKIRDLESRIPAALNDADAEALAEAQTKADAVFSAFGQSAPRPLAGETADGYRRRYLGKLKSHSAVWANVDLAKADSAILDIAEPVIHADSFKAANAPATIGEGRLVPRSRRSPSGHMITEFVGDSAKYLSSFAAKPMKLVGVNTKRA